MSRLWLWAVRTAAGLGFLLIGVTCTPALRWWTNALSATWGDERGDVLIVLAGDTAGNNLIGLSSYWRSYYTVLEWREHRYRTVVITGARASTAMRDYVVSQGVPAASVQIEGAATSTHESAQFVSAMLKGDSGTKVLLTSDYHSGRTQRAFRNRGLQASCIPIPDAHKRVNSIEQSWGLFCMLAQETAKLAYYAVRGWL